MCYDILLPYPAIAFVYLLHHSIQTGALAALLNDVRAHQLKRTVGSGPCSGQANKQLYTSQMLCAAITPEQVAAIKRADVEKELVPKVGPGFRTTL